MQSIVRTFVLALSLAACLGAQTTASIFGAVTDETGLAIVGARLTAVNTLTNETRTTTTNQVGAYSLPALPVGAYALRCETQGFKTWIQEGIELSLNRNARLDVKMTVGALTEKVTVVSDAPLVETSTAEMGALVDKRRVADLPLNGRNTLSLVALVPGAQPLQSGGQVNTQGFVENTTVINGQRPQDSSWALDGGDNTSTLRNAGADVPNPDAIQEFRVVTNNYDAEYGRAAGGIINVITKSGTNEFHGTLAEFLRNRSINARNFFEPTTTALVQNQYGGTIGGPIRRDRTFFFGTYEGFRRRTSVSSADRARAFVPTEAERAGDFSASLDGSGRPVVVRDPLSATRQPFTGNIIPQSRLSQVATNYLKLAVALPNYPANGPNGIYQRASAARDRQQFMGKVDHNQSANHRLSGAYFWSGSVDGQPFQGDINFIRRDVQSRQHNLNLHEYWTIGATMLNHFRATYARSTGDRMVLPDNVTMNDLGAKFSPLPDGPIMPPQFRVSGYFNMSGPYGGPKAANHYTLADSLDWMKGRHNLKFGVEGWLRKMIDISSNPNSGGRFTFDGTRSGNSLADMMLGEVREFNIARQTYKNNNQWALYWFAQDKFRITRKLSLNLGIRYELDTWPTNAMDELVVWLPGRQSQCVPQAPSTILFPCDAGVPRAGAFNDLNNFAPRLGIAYDLFGSGKTILRAGYGISYAFALFNTLQEQQISVPFNYVQNIFLTTLADPYAPIGGSPFPFLTDPANRQFPSGAEYSFQDLNQRNAYVQQWDFTIQRQIGQDWSVELAYVGNTARKLAGSYDINAPLLLPTASAANVNQRRPMYPTFAAVMRTAGGFTNSSYNAFHARVEKRFSRKFTVLGAYAAGKSLDDATNFSSVNQWVDPRNRRLDRGRSQFDQAHTLTVSWLWQSPLFQQQKGVVAAILGGWSVNGIASLFSGQPVFLATDRDNDYNGSAANDRPDVVGDWPLDPNRTRAEVIQAWFNPQAFAANQPGRIGNAGRDFFSGPGLKNVDLGVFKNIPLHERRQIQFRCEMFNAFNWTNLGAPEFRVSRATFGQITTHNASAPARVFQFGLKYLF